MFLRPSRVSCQSLSSRLSRAMLALVLLPIFGVGLVLLSRREPSCSTDTLTASASPARPTNVPSATADSCALEIERLLSEPALSGAPQLERERAEILARSRAEPVLFLREPKSQGSTAVATRLRQQLLAAPLPWTVFEQILKQSQAHLQLTRQVLLADGYLYADQPALAALISTSVTLPLLFREPELSLTRGTKTYRLVRNGKSYTYADGPESGRTATLWLFDRVTVASETRSADSHISLSDVRAQLGARTFQVDRITERALVGRFQYGNLSVPTVLTLEGSRAVFDCESTTESVRVDLARERALAHRKQRLLEQLRLAITAQVDAALPFDEPRTEEGQQDGALRREWQTAYLQGRDSFTFNGDHYRIFDAEGRVRTPQVCADFITDSWERMGDTYYLPRGGPRGKQVGRLDFDTLGVANRRSVENLMEFAASHPSLFAFLPIPESERIPFANRRAFFARLQSMHREFSPGDVVAILGPRDDERLHYHSFFIVADDPITGIPILVASNAGRPRIRTWEAEMNNAPRRAIVGRIRPTIAWLESVSGQALSTQ